MERLLLTRPSAYKLELLWQEAKAVIGDRLLDVNEVEPDKMAFYFRDGVQPGDKAACQGILNAHDPRILTPEEERRRREEEAFADYLVNALKGMTPGEAAQYIEDNVTNLASAKAVLKTLARLVVALAIHTLER